MRNRVNQIDFASLCAQMTRKEIAVHLGITIWSVIHYEEKWSTRPRPGRRGRRAATPIKVASPVAEPVAHDESAPSRLSYLVQGGLWLDLRQVRAPA